MGDSGQDAIPTRRLRRRATTPSLIPPPEIPPDFVPKSLPIPPRPKRLQPVPSYSSMRERVPFPSSPRSPNSAAWPKCIKAEPNPIQELCQHMNVRPIVLGLSERVPTTVDIPYSPRLSLPTHFLWAQDSRETATQRNLIPVRQDLLAARIRAELIPPSTSHPSSSTMPFYRGKVAHITLPVVTIQVPNADTIPLLFLFALGVRPMDELATSLLPPEVIEEFPSSAAMSEILARQPESQTRKYVTQNHLLWMNILALGPKDEELTEMVNTAWNVVAASVRIRRQSEEGRCATKPRGVP